MEGIIDLNAERNKRAQPDPEFIRHDDFGRPMYHYLPSYEYDGKTWGGVHVWAYDEADAAGRVAAMRESLILLGQAFQAVPA